MGGSFPSSHRPSRDRWCYWSAQQEPLRRRVVQCLKWFFLCLLCDNQIWFLFFGCQSNKIERHKNLFTCIEPVRHWNFFRFTVNIVAPFFIHRWGHSRWPSTNTRDGSKRKCRKNWSFAEFEKNRSWKRLWNIRQSGRRKLHVFCNLRTAGAHTRSKTLS